VRARFSAVMDLALTILLVTWFSPAAAQSSYKILHSFRGNPDGGGVYAGLAIDGKGALYGTTCCGGAYGEGTVFQLTPGAGGKWSEKILHSFCADPHCTDGELPMEGVVVDGAGNVYGTAGGGHNNYGVAYELAPDPYSAPGWVYRVIYESGSEGLILDQGGNLYGEWGPGKYGKGDVFELSPRSGDWNQTLLYSFCSQQDCRDGLGPLYGLTWDASGNLYGVTTQGGANKWGVAFELEHTASGWKESVLYDFPAYEPGSSLTFDSKGNLYGTTFQEGPCDGTVYQLSPQGKGRWKRTILYHFCNPDKNGGAPAGGVTFDNLGNLYGTASAGGEPNCDCGVVFKMTPQASGKWKYSVQHRFKGTDGIGPGYNLIFDKGYKHLYGTTVEGGSGGYGVVYEITP
jgi:uncharacterized repeat protein (TIGR03803 family)